MEVIAVGTCGTYPGPGRACQGWLVREGGANVLLDCGPSVVSALQQYIPLAELTAVVISHLHVDHFLDLLTLCYSLRFGPEPRPHPALLLPPGSLGQLEALVRPFTSIPDEFFRNSFDILEYQTGQTAQFGPLTLDFAPMRHYVPCWGTSVTSGSGKVVYSADTAPTPELVRLGRDADLFIAEAALAREDEDDPAARGHSTPAEAAAMARDAAARKLLLTHIRPHQNEAKFVHAAEKVFGARVQAAREGDRFLLSELG